MYGYIILNLVNQTASYEKKSGSIKYIITRFDP